MKSQLFCKVIFGIYLFFSTGNVFSQLALNTQAQAILSNPSTGLVATTLNDTNYTYADRNTNAIAYALSVLTPGQDLQLPDGMYDVTTIQIPSLLSGLTITGTGINTTILRRKAFTWDNNSQGDCLLRTEIFRVQNIQSFELRDMTLDGNCHQIAICGEGTFDLSTGQIVDRTPQFPVYSNNESSGNVINIILSNDINFDNVNFKNGYGWCVYLGKTNGFHMQNCIIDTGNLSTEFKGHKNLNNDLMHAHTSQDGLHLVNVSNALIEYNDIHSEDSGIALELNPLWDWGGYDISQNIIIRNNYVSTASPTDPDKLMNNVDQIYGSGLADRWIGQSAVDIFYCDPFDPEGQILMGGNQGPFRNIEISQNAFDGVRQGVRCGFFLGGGANNSENINHRIYNLKIKDNCPTYMAGRDRNKPAGIQNVNKNDISTSWNLNGGAGIAVRHTDSVLVSNNFIKKCNGGIGINVQEVTEFYILNNIVDSISGTQLGNVDWTGDQYVWAGGEGIRVYNTQSTGQYDALNFLIQGNKIGAVATSKIAVINTKNGVAKLDENYNLSNLSLFQISKGINAQNTSNIDWGVFSPSITNTTVSSVLTSDNFENQSEWARCSSLNNQLGGVENHSWYYWGGQLAWPGISAVGGTKAMGVVWGGIVPLTGFAINTDSIYQIECLVHSTGGNDGTWNNWSGVHLFASDDTNIWQNSGVRIRLQNGATGIGFSNPSRLITEWWEGINNTYHNVEVNDFSADPTVYQINGANENNFWIPLKLIFTGAGNSYSPLKIDYYLNDTFVGSTSLDNLSGLGDRMLGLARYGTSNDNAAFDNFKLTKLRNNTPSYVNSFMTNSIEVKDPVNKEFSVQYNNKSLGIEIYSATNSPAEYQIYNLAGIPLYTGNITKNKTVVATNELHRGVYIVKIVNLSSSKTETFKVIAQ
ncbi:MAG: T9SS type A sorting domain-containing protein [Paludibacter sp.]|nr:T9SS type A sorting domain-containing protein [Paludibacter sp.]